jgi:hypothetical protein
MSSNASEDLIRPARSDESARLTAIALRSKAHWGYSAEFMAEGFYLRMGALRVGEVESSVQARRFLSRLHYQL